MRADYGPYSKEVMKHFIHPKGIGQIKDADGIGKVGNIICVIPDTKIFTNGIIKPIKKISEKDYVLSHDGKYCSVIEKHKRWYKGQVIKLKNKLGDTILTPEHMVLAIKIPKKWKYSFMKNKKQLKPAWYHTKDLEKGDILLYPILREVEDTQRILFPIKKFKYDFKSKTLPRVVPINSNFLKLCGYFIAEGCTQIKMCRSCLSFTFNINEEKYVKEVVNIVKKIFGLCAKINYNNEHNTIVIRVDSAKLARFFRKMFGDRAENKHIPHFMMLLPPEKQKSLISGIWRGDGYINKKRAEYSTISTKLAQQLKLLLLRQKIAPSLYKEKERTINGVRHKKCYRIHIEDKKSLLKLSKILRISINIEREEKPKWWFDNKYFYLPLAKTEKLNYNGYVYNLEVEKAHSFVSESSTLHNCGDVVWFYLKIKKDKKTGKEKIADIKFQTFGCIVAIANSSMITTMVKGKTLEEALKLKKEDVLKKLGEVPPIKVHCSVLAVDALREAIYDYFIKNKLPIPDNLQKDHERIQQTLKTVEEKHKEYIEFEKEVLKEKQG